jgi:hypothetical protein
MITEGFILVVLLLLFSTFYVLRWPIRTSAPAPAAPAPAAPAPPPPAPPVGDTTTDGNKTRRPRPRIPCNRWNREDDARLKDLAEVAKILSSKLPVGTKEVIKFITDEMVVDSHELKMDLSRENILNIYILVRIVYMFNLEHPKSPLYLIPSYISQSENGDIVFFLNFNDKKGKEVVGYTLTSIFAMPPSKWYSIDLSNPTHSNVNPQDDIMYLFGIVYLHLSGAFIEFELDMITVLNSMVNHNKIEDKDKNPNVISIETIFKELIVRSTRHESESHKEHSEYNKGLILQCFGLSERDPQASTRLLFDILRSFGGELRCSKDIIMYYVGLSDSLILQITLSFLDGDSYPIVLQIDRTGIGSDLGNLRKVAASNYPDVFGKDNWGVQSLNCDGIVDTISVEYILPELTCGNVESPLELLIVWNDPKKET